MAINLNESVVAITGASSGIGRATALRLAREKASIIAIARNEEALDTLKEECEKLGSRVETHSIDVTEEEAVKNVVRQAYEKFGRIDAWINDAAVSVFGRFEEIPAEDYWRVIQTNLFGYINCMRAILPRFRQQGKGVIINVSSMVGKIGQPYSSAYSASKAAISALSESVRMELIDTPNIHVCTVLPVSVDTPLFQHAANFFGYDVKPMSPVYSPEQVAEKIVKTIRHPRAEVVISGLSKPLTVLRQIAPVAFERVFAKRVQKEHFEEETVPETEGNLFEPMAEVSGTTGGWSHATKPAHMYAGAAAAVGVTALGAGALILLSRRFPIFPMIGKIARVR